MSVSPERVRLLLAVALLLAWEAAPRFGLIPTLFLPPFTETMVALWTSGPEYLRHLLLSAKAILVAGTIACGAGILLGLLAGAQTIDRHYLVVARSFGATRWQMVGRVLLPAAIPTVLSSLRVGGSLVIVGVIVAEMLTSAEGVGYLITKNRTLLDSPRVFAGILIVIFLVLAFDRGVRLLEHRTRFWRLSTQSAGVA